MNDAQVWSLIAAFTGVLGLLSTMVLRIVRVEVGSVRTEIGAVRTEIGAVRTEIDSVRTEIGSVRTELAAVDHRLSGQIAHLDRDVQTVIDRMMG